MGLYSLAKTGPLGCRDNAPWRLDAALGPSPGASVLIFYEESDSGHGVQAACALTEFYGKRKQPENLTKSCGPITLWPLLKIPDLGISAHDCVIDHVILCVIVHVILCT